MNQTIEHSHLATQALANRDLDSAAEHARRLNDRARRAVTGGRVLDLGQHYHNQLVQEQKAKHSAKKRARA